MSRRRLILEGATVVVTINEQRLVLREGESGGLCQGEHVVNWTKEALRIPTSTTLAESARE